MTESTSPTTPATRKSSPATWILAVVALLLAGGLGFTYQKDSTTISDQKSKITSLESENTTTKADLAKAKVDLAAAQANSVKGEACAAAVKDASSILVARFVGGDTTITDTTILAALTTATSKCDEVTKSS